MTLQGIKTYWIKARIAYHRRKADSYERPVAQSFRRDGYQTWLRTMAFRHAMRASALERELLLDMT